MLEFEQYRCCPGTFEVDGTVSINDRHIWELNSNKNHSNRHSNNSWENSEHKSGSGSPSFSETVYVSNTNPSVKGNQLRRKVGRQEEGLGDRRAHDRGAAANRIHHRHVADLIAYGRELVFPDSFFKLGFKLEPFLELWIDLEYQMRERQSKEREQSQMPMRVPKTVTG